MIVKVPASCCGFVEVTPPQLRVVVCSLKEYSYYTFTCPLCERTVFTAAREDVIDALSVPGVEFELWDIPTTPNDSSEPPITIVDVERFAQDTHGIDRLAAAASTYFPQEEHP